MTSLVFLLSPANSSGKRARMLLNSRTSSLAGRLRDSGAPLGEVFTFMSSLYFRGKVTYAKTFGAPPEGWSGALIIAPGRGLLTADHVVHDQDLVAMGQVPVAHDNAAFREPLVRDAQALGQAIGEGGRVVLLGSIATAKYVDPLLEVFGARLLFPPAFVGRGDMSRGGLLLRSARAGMQLDYGPVDGAVRHGARPPKLGG